MHRRTLFISRLAIILGLTLIIQSGGFPQPITGPLINAILLITASLLGIVAGIILGTLTPIVALIRGQLPPVLAPMIPFIIIANGVFVTVFILLIKYLSATLRLNSDWSKALIALIFASLLKFLLLFSAVKIILPVVFAVRFPDKIILIMSTPQFVTAMIGGIIAIVAIRFLDNRIL